MLHRVALSLFGLLMSCAAHAITPYIYGNPLSAGTVQAVAAAAEGRLEAQGFKVVGKHFPKNHAGYGVIVVTDADMLKHIGDIGEQTIVAAGIRVGVKADGTVSYMNPDYWYRAFFRKNFSTVEKTAENIQKRLARALGAGEGFGGDESERSLSNYRYMVGMERLDSPKNKLAEAESFDAAVRTVRDNLAKKLADSSKVYEVVIPGKQLAVFGVAFNDPKTGDANWLKSIEKPEAVAGLPYEIFVIGKEIHALHARYRLAVSFPDTGMGTFMRISHIPGEILDTMSQVAGAKAADSASAP
jgi:hypothetical protein